MKVKLKQLTTGTRRINVPLAFMNEEGVLTTEDFAVVYKQYSPATTTKIQADLRKMFPKLVDPATNEKDDPEAKYILAEKLARMIVEIDGIVGDDGKNVKLTAADYDEFDLRNLTALNQAIEQDVTPDPTPSA